jgi:hypothetical protein
MRVFSVFALELCLRMDHGAHEALRQLVWARKDTRLTYDEKWKQYARIADTLLAYEGLWVRGCWEFFEEMGRVTSTFADWKNSFNGAAGAQRPVGLQPEGFYRSESTFMSLTVVFLIDQGSPSEQQLRAFCNIPENRLWAKATFRQMCANLKMVAPSAIAEDVVYLIPGHGNAGLTLAELREPRFDYLRPIV